MGLTYVEDLPLLQDELALAADARPVAAHRPRLRDSV
jgi:hypothetical protein